MCSSKRRTVGGGRFVTIYLYHLLGGADWKYQDGGEKDLRRLFVWSLGGDGDIDGN